MKKTSSIIIILLIAVSSFAQKKYFRPGGEYIFAFSDMSDNNIAIDSKMRFSFFFHFGEYFNYDINKIVGTYTGIGVRNIGIISTENNAIVKRRSYTAGIPFALKIGNLSKNSYFFAGGEYEYLFHYKEKTIINNEKSVHKSWTSDRTNTFLPSIFAGIQFKNGLNLKFKYYLDDFLNTSYSYIDSNNNVIQPYKLVKTSLYYISVSLNFNKYNWEKIKKLNPIKKDPKIIEV